MSTAAPMVVVHEPGRAALAPPLGIDPILFDLQRQLAEARAQVVTLCAAHGVTPPNGAMTLARIRALEDVRDLVEQHHRGAVPFSAVLAAALAAGRQP